MIVGTFSFLGTGFAGSLILGATDFLENISKISAKRTSAVMGKFQIIPRPQEESVF